MNEAKCEMVGILNYGKYKKMTDIYRGVYSVEGLSPTLRAVVGGNTQVKVMVYEIHNDDRTDTD